MARKGVAPAFTLINVIVGLSQERPRAGTSRHPPNEPSSWTLHPTIPSQTSGVTRMAGHRSPVGYCKMSATFALILFPDIHPEIEDTYIKWLAAKIIMSVETLEIYSHY
ncbi:hypothetical protein HZH68_008772 [Vespula germanica]|uniref:Uncharacterized protein n=1 Tax=Vespula germanica TaxID=30212 RepID=A0A834N6H8_VESGE|nr:hypothetical protein HZH68_008772 [Vespula germanica]